MYPFLSPPFALSLLLATIHALLFHLLWGRKVKELALFWVAAVLGFFLGQLAAEAAGFSFLLMGPVHPLEGSLGSWLFLFVAKRFKI